MYYQTFREGNYAPTLGDLVKNGYPVFNDWWTTYVPEHKEELIKKIIHTYYFEQIGSDTPDKFSYYINAQLERIMPYYNQLYASELLKFNPLLNYALDVTGKNISNMVSKANTSDDKFAKAIRDFVGLTDRSGQTASVGTESGSLTKHDTGHSEYSKDGTEDTTGTRDRTENEKTTTNDTTTLDGTQKTTGTDTTVFNTSVKTDGTVTETPNDTTVKKMG